LEKENWTKEELRDSRYDAIIHLVTAADGAPLFYDRKNLNSYETPEEAIERDHALKTVYLGHNKVFFINNEKDEDFTGKMRKTI
jgi:hypothetical protein